MSVKKSRCNALQVDIINNKLLKRATGKDPGIDRKCVGGAELSNNVRTNKISSFKNGCVARVVLREGEERRVRGGEKGSLEGREKKGL